MNHIDATSLELYVLKGSEISLRRVEIEAHLLECRECASLQREIEAYYTEVENLARAHDKAIAIVDGWVRPRLVAEPGRVLNVLHSVPVRAFHFAVSHPIPSSAISVALVLGLVLLFARVTGKDPSPAQVKAVGEFLVVQNIKGDELWRKDIGSQFEEKAKDSKYFGVVDVDKDGSKEVLMMSPRGVSSSDMSPGTVLCYDSKGNEHWRFRFKPDVKFSGEAFSSDYGVEGPLLVENLRKDEAQAAIFAVHHADWWPSAVLSLNVMDGSIDGTYWHPGWIKIESQDIDGNGEKEIVASGYNNAFKKSCLIILDPKMIRGHAPATEPFTPIGVPGALEKYYVLLPNPDIYELANHWTEGSRATLNSAGELEIRVGRILPGTKPGEWVGAVVFFYFDKNLRCTSVKAGDDFESVHVRLEKEGKTRRKLDVGYFRELRNGVQYWNGEAFVMEPSMNKKYLENAEKNH